MIVLSVGIFPDADRNRAWFKAIIVLRATDENLVARKFIEKTKNQIIKGLI